MQYFVHVSRQPLSVAMSRDVQDAIDSIEEDDDEEDEEEKVRYNRLQYVALNNSSYKHIQRPNLMHP